MTGSLERKPVTLVIDDSLTARMFVKDILEGEGMVVHLCKDAESGSEAARTLKPDVVLLDVVLPGIDGITLCEQWRSDSELRDLPVLLMSGERAERDDRAAGLQAGALGYVVKPFNKSEMLAQVYLLYRLKETHEALKKQAQLARDGSEAKSRFLANMSHEIRTPLTSILGFAETLLHDGLPKAEKAKAVGTILRNGQHLLGVVNDLLDLSKIEAGKIEIESRECTCSDLIQDVAAFLKLKCEEKGLGFDVDVSYPLPSRFISDPLRLKQILFNLVSNAVKFTHQGKVSVAVSYDKKSSDLTFEVRDSGIGISAEKLTRLFRPFSQAEVATARVYGGTGLGLSISRELAHLLRGSLEVSSEEGKGSSFVLTLSRIAISDLIWGEQKRELEVTGEGASTNLTGSVLLIEDSSDIRALLSHSLRKRGLTVVEAENGSVGLARAQERDFTLILSDMQMPVLDGYQTVKILREEGFTGPIVALTGNVMGPDLERVFEVGCDDYLAKPFTRQSLFDILERYISSEETSDFDEDPEFLALVARYRTSLPHRLQELEDFSAQENWGAVESASHKLIGAGTFGLPRMSSIARSMERAAKSKDKSAIERLLKAARGMCG